jgi:hypothetical protein
MEKVFQDNNVNKDLVVVTVDQENMTSNEVIRENSRSTEDVFLDAVPISSEEVELISCENEISSEVILSENLRPTFAMSSLLPSFGPKGQSKANLGKGKRIRTAYETKKTLDDLDGDLLIGLETSKQNCMKNLYRLARESQRDEKIRRAENSMVLRIDEMNTKKLLTLSECTQIFMGEFIPMSLTIPKLLSQQALSDLLKVDPESSFIGIISESRKIQDVMRRAILEGKNLPVCCCGYIYVHPSLTYAKHPTDSNLLISKQPYTEKLTTIKRADVIKNLNSLRYYLEILYEYYNT